MNSLVLISLLLSIQCIYLSSCKRRIFCAEIVEKFFFDIFIYLIFLCKDTPFPFITKFKSNRTPSYSSVNRIQNYIAAASIYARYTCI